MSKTLCERKKDLKHDFESYALLVCQPRFVCRDCGRACNKKKYLCEPEKINFELLTMAETMAEIEETIIPISEIFATAN